MDGDGCSRSRLHSVTDWVMMDRTTTQATYWVATVEHNARAAGDTTAAAVGRHCWSFPVGDGPSQRSAQLVRRIRSRNVDQVEALFPVQCLFQCINCNNKDQKHIQGGSTYVMKKTLGETQTLRAGFSKAEPKNFAPPQTPFLGAHEGQNLISWRWSLPSPTDPVWWRSMHAISSYRKKLLILCLLI